MPTLVAAVGGGAIEALAAANGYWLETPAVHVAASWLKARREDRLRGCTPLPIGKARS